MESFHFHLSQWQKVKTTVKWYLWEETTYFIYVYLPNLCALVSLQLSGRVLIWFCKHLRSHSFLSSSLLSLCPSAGEWSRGETAGVKITLLKLCNKSFPKRVIYPSKTKDWQKSTLTSEIQVKICYLNAPNLYLATVVRLLEALLLMEEKLVLAKAIAQ